MQGLQLCPFCGHNPTRFHTRWKATLVSAVLGLIVGLVVVLVTPPPPPLVALSVSPTHAPLVPSSPRPTFTPTATHTPLPTATASQTPTSPPTATATHTPVTIVQNLPTATSTASATPRPTVAPPRLLSPKDQHEFGGEDVEIILQWEGTLQEGQQYAVTVRYIGKGDETKTVGSWLRETRWRVPNPVYRDISLMLRALKWDVMIIDASGNAVSPPSESRIFIWSQ